jgi:hypothetical protein
MIKFQIKNRFTAAVQFECELDCAADASEGFKLGLAVKLAIKAKVDLSRADLSRADLSGAYLSGADLSGADLSGAYLSGAYLSGADLSRAYLSRAYLSGAYLSGAYLSGAYLSGAKIVRLVARATRSDGYEFFGFEFDDGRLFIRAGCQSRDMASYRQHVTTYGDKAKTRETTDILDFIEKRAAALAP